MSEGAWFYGLMGALAAVALVGTICFAYSVGASDCLKQRVVSCVGHVK